MFFGKLSLGILANCVLKMKRVFVDIKCLDIVSVIAGTTEMGHLVSSFLFVQYSRLFFC